MIAFGKVCHLRPHCHPGSTKAGEQHNRWFVRVSQQFVVDRGILGFDVRHGTVLVAVAMLVLAEFRVLALWRFTRGDGQSSLRPFPPFAAPMALSSASSSSG